MKHRFSSNPGSAGTGRVKSLVGYTERAHEGYRADDRGTAGLSATDASFTRHHGTRASARLSALAGSRSTRLGVQVGPIEAGLIDDRAGTGEGL